jgi:hypothetical protein
VSGFLADRIRRKAASTNPTQHVLDDLVRLCDDADAPSVLAREGCDDVRRGVRLARAGGALHGEVRVVHRHESPDDDLVRRLSAKGRVDQRTAIREPRGTPAQNVHGGGRRQHR